MKPFNNFCLIITLMVVSAFLSVTCVDGDDGAALTGEIEIAYGERGSYNTTKSSISGYELYYPSNLVGEHPIITWGNGTFAVPSYYAELLDHFASYGFVVIASTSTMTGSGIEMLEGVDWLQTANSDSESIFYEKLDLDRVGAMGHSQGGGGAISAGADSRIKCTAPIQPISDNVENLQGPMFLIAGSEDTIVPASVITTDIYDPSPVLTVYGTAIGANHFTPLGDGGMIRGYLTAWFCALLKDDVYALGAFTGNCEICNNQNWYVLRKNM